MHLLAVHALAADPLAAAQAVGAAVQLPIEAPRCLARPVGATLHLLLAVPVLAEAPHHLAQTVEPAGQELAAAPQSVGPGAHALAAAEHRHHCRHLSSQHWTSRPDGSVIEAYLKGDTGLSHPLRTSSAFCRLPFCSGLSSRASLVRFGTMPDYHMQTLLTAVHACWGPRM